MKYTPKPTKKFFKKMRKYERSGRFDIDKVKKVIKKLADGEKLDIKYRDHQLKGKFKDFRECHIEPDLLLIYQIIDDELILILVDLGSHSELFE